MESHFKGLLAAQLALVLVGPHAFSQGREGIPLDSTVEYRGKASSETLTRQRATLLGQDSLSTRINASIQRVTRTRYLLPKGSEIKVCQGPTDGSSPLWAFYNESSAGRKILLLSNAVVGLDEATANCLINRGLFAQKPKNWEAFVEELKKAGEECGQDLLKSIAKTHEHENRRRLGYNQCTQQVTAEDRIESKENEEKHSQVSCDFRLDFVNAPLLPGEKESFKVTFDGYQAKLELSEDLNRYQVESYREGNTTVYQLTGERKRNRPENFITVLAKNLGGELVLEIRPENFDADIYPYLGEAILYFEVRQDRPLLPDRSLAKGLRASLDLSRESSEIHTGFQFARDEKDMKAFVEYRVQFELSPFFNDKHSGYRQSNRLEVTEGSASVLP